MPLMGKKKEMLKNKSLECYSQTLKMIKHDSTFGNITIQKNEGSREGYEVCERRRNYKTSLIDVFKIQ